MTSSNVFRRGDKVEVSDDQDLRYEFTMMFGAATPLGPYTVDDPVNNILLLRDSDGALSLTAPARFFVKRKLPRLPDGLKPGIFVTITETKHRAKVLAVNPESGEVSLNGYGRMHFTKVQI